MNTRKRQRGLSLIELMVAMTIGAVLIFGASQVYINSRNAYGVSESVARLQETARYAMSVIEPDVRMSNYWGLLKGAAVIANQASQTAAVAAVAPTAAANVCGRNFAVDLSTNLQGDNNAYVISTNAKTAGCEALLDLTTGVAWNTTPVTTADTLTVRRASVFDAVSTAGQLQICASRIAGRLMSDGSVCTGAAVGLADNLAVSKLENLIVDTYYVDRNSQQQAGLPSLRRKTVVSVGGAIQFRDQEIIPGVEDMQIQFGIDPLGNTGVATRYINPPTLAAMPAGAQIVSVRIWLLVRSDTPENGFTDNRIYQYGDRLQATGVTGDLNSAAGAGMAYQPSLNADASFTGPRRVRRLLISRTIQVRNALGT